MRRASAISTTFPQRNRLSVIVRTPTGLYRDVSARPCYLLSRSALGWQVDRRWARYGRPSEPATCRFEGPTVDALAVAPPHRQAIAEMP